MKSAVMKDLLKSGQLGFGCLETWLLLKLTDGNVHIAEASNYSSSGMFDPFINDYNKTILRIIGFPLAILPPLVDSASERPLGLVARRLFSRKIPIHTVLADQQSALYGTGGWRPGDIKGYHPFGVWRVTNYSVCCRRMENDALIGVVLKWATKHSLFADVTQTSALAATVQNSNGVLFVPAFGGCILSHFQGLQTPINDDTACCGFLGLFADVTQTSALAATVQNSNGVLFVPAFGGLQTPINDDTACCGFLGIRPDTTKAHMVRAILESIAFRVYQIFETMRVEVEILSKPRIRICGGVAANDFVCETIATLTDIPIQRRRTVVTWFRGVGLLGRYCFKGMWSEADLETMVEVDRCFMPSEEASESLRQSYRLWLKAVQRCSKFYDS
ncbi:carbohydrate kinase, FGGY family protein [Ostertagia ostertagi]